MRRKCVLVKKQIPLVKLRSMKKTVPLACIYSTLNIVIRFELVAGLGRNVWTTKNVYTTFS